MEDSLYYSYVNYLNDGTLPLRFPSTKSNFIAVCQKFRLNENIYLIRNDKLVLRKSELENVFQEIHQHSGRDKTYEKFHNRFWFHGMSVWIREKVRSCVSCGNKNNVQWPAHRSPLIPIKVEPKLFWRVHCDLIGPLPQTRNKNKYICLAVCALSKYPEAAGNTHLFSTVFPCLYNIFSANIPVVSSNTF